MIFVKISYIFLLLFLNSVPSFSTDLHVGSYEPLVKRDLADFKVNVYESTKDGARFAFKQIEFDFPIPAAFGNLKAEVNINVNNKRQEIQGFGGAFTDSATENLMKLDQKLRQKIIDDYFDKANGLGYTLGRSTIGGSDFSSRAYTLNDAENDYELKNFALTKEDTDYKIPIIKMAMQHEPNLKIISTVWSPPIWLKTNKDFKHRGRIVGDVKDKSFVTYANYFVRYLDAYKKEGINIYGISPANEPVNGLMPMFPFNCIGFTPNLMRDFIFETLGPTLHSAGYTKDKLKLFIGDDQRLYLKSYVSPILSHPNASDYVTGLAYHWYFNQITGAGVLDAYKNEHPDLDIWSTEACTGSFAKFKFEKNVEIGNWNRGEQYAVDITEDLNHYTNSWIDWNLALDMNGGPNWSKNFADAPIIIDFANNNYIRQPMFYALAHFTKFLTPGSVNLEQIVRVSGNFLKRGSVHSTSFKTPEGHIVSIVTNTYDYDLKLTINVHQNTTQTINLVVEKKSITTITWKD